MHTIIPYIAMAAFAAAAFPLLLWEHRRITWVRGDLAGQSKTVDMLMMALDRHERRLKAHAAIQTQIIDALEYDHPAPAGGSREQQIRARIDQIRAQFTARAGELDGLIRELEGAETQRALPEGWSVVQGGGEKGLHTMETPGGEQRRPTLTVVAS